VELNCGPSARAKKARAVMLSSAVAVCIVCVGTISMCECECVCVCGEGSNCDWYRSAVPIVIGVCERSNLPSISNKPLRISRLTDVRCRNVISSSKAVQSVQNVVIPIFSVLRGRLEEAPFKVLEK
jgi:hypothetical protein